MTKSTNIRCLNPLCHRRNIRYIPCREVKIAALLDELTFTRGNRNWGYHFRYGHFEVGFEDFLTIADAMLGDVEGIQLM